MIKKYSIMIILIFGTYSMLFSSIEVKSLTVSVYKLLKDDQKNDSFIWIGWRVPESDSLFNESNVLSSIKNEPRTKFENNYLKLCDINWKHYRSSEEVEPRRMNFYIFDGSFYLFIVESFKGDYSIQVFCHSYKLINGKLCIQPDDTQRIFEKNNIIINENLNIDLGNDVQYLFEFSFKEVLPNDKLKPINDMAFTVYQFGNDFFHPKLIHENNGYVKILVDAFFGIYGKYSDKLIYKDCGGIDSYLEKSFKNMHIDRRIGVPDKFYLRSKFFFKINNSKKIK